MTKHFLGASAVLALMASGALAEPGLIIDLGGKFDKSFNESAYNGAERWAEETGGDYRETELQSEAQREQSMRRMAESGANPVVVLGFANASTLEKVAPDYPETSFAIVDSVVEQPNVKSIVFTEHEGSYLAGMLAAMASETGTVSFVGGMDIPLIRKFACGYAQGVKAADSEAEIIVNYTGTTPAAWNDPVKGGELTRAQISQGSDVVYAAAGGTGVGVLQTAADEDVLSIGGGQQPELPPPGLGADLDAQARGQRRLRGLLGGRRGLRARRRGARPRRRGRGLRGGRAQRVPDHRGDAHRRRGGAPADHRRRDRGARLHHGRHLPGALSPGARARAMTRIGAPRPLPAPAAGRGPA